MSLMICRLGGTTLLTRSIDITYWAMALGVKGWTEGREPDRNPAALPTDVRAARPSTAHRPTLARRTPFNGTFAGLSG